MKKLEFEDYIEYQIKKLNPRTRIRLNGSRPLLGWKNLILL